MIILLTAYFVCFEAFLLLFWSAEAVTLIFAKKKVYLLTSKKLTGPKKIRVLGKRVRRLFLVGIFLLQETYHSHGCA